MWKKTNSREQRKKACPDDPRTHAKKADGAWGWQASESYFSFLLTTFSSFFLLLCGFSSSSPFPLFFFFHSLISAPSFFFHLLLKSPFSSCSSRSKTPQKDRFLFLSLSNSPPRTPISTNRDAVFDLCLLGRLAKRSRQGILGFMGM